MTPATGHATANGDVDAACDVNARGQRRRRAGSRRQVLRRWIATQTPPATGTGVGGGVVEPRRLRLRFAGICLAGCGGKKREGGDGRRSRGKEEGRRGRRSRREEEGRRGSVRGSGGEKERGSDSATPRDEAVIAGRRSGVRLAIVGKGAT
nr:unnamed protein product [Digitaria exilis]